jgi:hypothetical protein
MSDGVVFGVVSIEVGSIASSTAKFVSNTNGHKRKMEVWEYYNPNPFH